MDRFYYNPLITKESEAFLKSMYESSHAPRFNHAAGDKIIDQDLIDLEKFRKEQFLSKEISEILSIPPSHILKRVEHIYKDTPFYRRKNHNPARDWQKTEFCSREDLARAPQLFVPDDVPLNRMICFKTAGTTGHPLKVFSHPKSTASYQVIIDKALETYNVQLEHKAQTSSCFLIGAQKHTVTYPTVLSVWNQAAFAKINLDLAQWPKKESPSLYFNEFHPKLLTGDPLSFSHLLKHINLNYSPKALISTAIALNTNLKAQLSESFGCPVIDWYSMTETGPVAFAAADGHGYQIILDDIFIELIDQNNEQVLEPGVRGEVTITGGRNPFLPLVRYRTGDWAEWSFHNDKLRLIHLEGRCPVLFKTPTQKIINTVDISQTLRKYPLVQHEFSQKRNYDCEVVIRPVTKLTEHDFNQLKTELSDLFLNEVNINIVIDSKLGDNRVGDKLFPYKTEMKLEE